MTQFRSISFFGFAALAACADDIATTTDESALCDKYLECLVSPQPRVFPPDSTPFGQSISAWSEDWWQWVMRTPASESAVLGEDCGLHQSGDVFYLAGNFGGAETRNCVVPQGKALFFPILNAVCYPGPDLSDCNQPLTEPQLRECASFDPSTELELTLTIDGHPVDDLVAHRATSGLFSWSAPDDPTEYVFGGAGPVGPNTCGVPEGDRSGVSDGYWIMVKPLPPGPHLLRFAGRVVDPRFGEFSLDLTYRLWQR